VNFDILTDNSLDTSSINLICNMIAFIVCFTNLFPGLVGVSVLLCVVHTKVGNWGHDFGKSKL
jgi:hypothetical protein